MGSNREKTENNINNRMNRYRGDNYSSVPITNFLLITGFYFGFFQKPKITYSEKR